MTEQTALATIYQQKQTPRSVSIEVGKSYKLTDGTSVEVIALRTNGTNIQVYYKYPSTRSKWYKTTYNFNDISLEGFKSKLLELGSFDKLTVTPFIDSKD